MRCLLVFFFFFCDLLSSAFLANMTEDAVIVKIAKEIAIRAAREAAIHAKKDSAETAIRPLASLFAVRAADVIMPDAAFQGFK